MIQPHGGRDVIKVGWLDIGCCELLQMPSCALVSCDQASGFLHRLPVAPCLRSASAFPSRPSRLI